jgi:hypothetical protein
MMTPHQFERDGSHPRRATQDVVRRAFEAAGVQFIDENGGGPGCAATCADPPRNLESSAQAPALEAAGVEFIDANGGGTGVPGCLRT